MRSYYVDFCHLNTLFGVESSELPGVWIEDDGTKLSVPSWNKGVPCEHKEKISEGMRRRFSQTSKEELSRQARQAVETKKKNMDWEEYSDLPVWKEQVVKKGTKITIVSVDETEVFTYNSIREAEREGWSKKTIQRKLKDGKHYRRREDGKHFRIRKV